MTNIKSKLALFAACLGLGVVPAASLGATQPTPYKPSVTPPAKTGKRAKAVTKCKKRFPKKNISDGSREDKREFRQFQGCLKTANKQPV